MKKIFHLSTCTTCQRILKDLPKHALELQDIKSEAITETQLEEMKHLAGSYEALFSKRSMKYRAWGLNEKELSEDDMKDYILKEYTFLKRPVAVIDDNIFIGNAKKNVEALIAFLSN
ncbi:MAG: arsenate reductase [Flavobacteriales bacterium]|nr:arsenate reductase [Flavobacteriales bacterium]